MQGSSGWASRVAERALGLRERLGRTVSVGISGVDCAGKSTLAAAVELALRERDVPALVIPGDEFTRPTADRYRETDEALGYYRDSFDYGPLFEQILPAVREGAPSELTVNVSDWERDGWRAERVALPEHGVVVVEGCFLFADQRAHEFDLSVWIDLSLDDVVPRALSRPRDLERMGGPVGVRERYERRYVPGQQIHLARDEPAAHASLVLG